MATKRSRWKAIAVRSVVLPAILASLIVQSPSHAADYGQPFTKGRVCLDYQQGSLISPGQACYVDPPNNGYTPTASDPFVANNATATGARYGHLAVGGHERGVIPLTPWSVWFAEVRSSATFLRFNSSTATQTVVATATGDIIEESFGSLTCSYYCTYPDPIRLCIRIRDLGPVSGSTPPAPASPLGEYCQELPSGYLDFGHDLTTIGTVNVPNGIARKISVEVELLRGFATGNAKVEIYSITYNNA
ncbi:MAG: hypothetical protein ABR507_00040 [Actinomycetota bacterium]|nr:hypothetical protein [Actinomycetota bacterium]